MFITGAHPADANQISPSQPSGHCKTAECITDWHNLLFMDLVDRPNMRDTLQQDVSEAGFRNVLL